MFSKVRSFFTQLRFNSFKRKIETEIYDRIFPHHRGERNHGYPFEGRKDMNAQTEQFRVHETLATVERHIGNMPDAYGESFRYIMHRDLQKRLRMYERLAARRTRKPCDPRFIATRLEPAR